MARLYFDTIGVDILKWRQEVQILARNIFSAFRFLLNSVDWLDSEDKEKIQEKVDFIQFNPGIPSWIGDDKKVMERIEIYNMTLDPFENEFVASKTTFDRMAEMMIVQSNELEADAWLDPSFRISANFDPNVNRINMFLGFMVPPLFNVSYPLPVKYGGLVSGAVIGHELLHAFDSNWIYYGGHADQKWLKEGGLQEFVKKKECLERQYSKFCYKEKGQCVSGTRTLSENIADIDGLKVAYAAYKIATQVVGIDPPIPDLVHYTGDQLFFMAFARTWCAEQTEASVNLEDIHTPNKPRVEAAVKNVPVFAKAFGCTVGSKYAPVTRCSVWGELEDPPS